MDERFNAHDPVEQWLGRPRSRMVGDDIQRARQSGGISEATCGSRGSLNQQSQVTTFSFLILHPYYSFTSLYLTHRLVAGSGQMWLAILLIRTDSCHAFCFLFSESKNEMKRKLYSIKFRNLTKEMVRRAQNDVRDSVSGRQAVAKVFRVESSLHEAGALRR